jgi:hypothetical protein
MALWICPVHADEPSAVQTVYRAGVPHTTRHGARLTKYDPNSSFFPVAAWGVPQPCDVYGHVYDWHLLKEAGFNTVWPWPMPAADALEAAKKEGLQVVLMNELDDATLQQIKDHPNLLGNVWMDEPIGKLGSVNMDELFGKFTAYKQNAAGIAPDLLVFVNDAPWIMPPATDWWIKWNTAGDVSCHDNYPIWPVTQSIALGNGGTGPNGIPKTVSLAVQANHESKPVWLIVSAFTAAGPPDASFPFRHPTPQQLRAMVYSGIVHGATGIVYFIWDSYVSRDGGIIGMSPNPDVKYGAMKTTATPMQLVAAKSLWDAASRINAELNELTPSLLAPTTGPDVAYTVEATGPSKTPAPIRALLKPHPQDGYLLLTVNNDNAPLKAKITFPKPLKTVEPMFENRSPLPVQANSTQFADDYEPFDVHVYHISLTEP